MKSCFVTSPSPPLSFFLLTIAEYLLRAALDSGTVLSIRNTVVSKRPNVCFLGRFGLNPGLPHCRQRLYPLSHQGSPLGKINISCKGFPGGSVVKNLPTNAGHSSFILGSGRSPGVGNGTPLQDSCLGKIPWTEEPGGLHSMGSQRHNWVSTTLVKQLEQSPIFGKYSINTSYYL